MKKALIIQNKFVGDVLVASLLAKNLKKIFPTIEVHFFCYDKALGVLQGNIFIDKIISFDNEKLKKINNLWKMSSTLKAEKYDIILDPYAKLQSRFIVFRTNATRKVSFDKPIFKYIYTDVIKEYETPKFVSCTSVEDRLKLLSPFTNELSSLDFQTEIFLSESEISEAKSLMLNEKVDFSKPIIVVGVLGSEPKKTLPLPYMADIVNFLLQNFQCNILFNYVPNQQKEVDKLMQLIPEKDKIFTTILGNSVRDFAAILYHCNALIANEGGAINIAKAMKIPTYSIFSPHKFRKDWACYENQNIHKSFHLEDIFPEVYSQISLDELLEKPEPFYALMRSRFILPEIEKFLENINLKPEKEIAISLPKNNLTALLITYNEEKNIRKYIENFAFADELIVVDSFSTDKTREICEEYPFVTFIQHKFKDFSSQKNYAISLAKNDWILFFDADEQLNDALKVEILKTINQTKTQNAYFIKRKFYFEGKPMNFSGWQNDKAIRLFKKEKCKYGENRKVHEIMNVKGSVGILRHKLDHYSFDSLASYVRKLNLYAKLRADELSEQNFQPNYFHFKVKPLFRFFHHYILRLGILDGKNGLTIASVYAKYVKKRYDYVIKNYQQKENQA